MLREIIRTVTRAMPSKGRRTWRVVDESGDTPIAIGLDRVAADRLSALCNAVDGLPVGDRIATRCRDAERAVLRIAEANALLVRAASLYEEAGEGQLVDRLVARRTPGERALDAALALRDAVFAEALVAARSSLAVADGAWATIGVADCRELLGVALEPGTGGAHFRLEGDALVVALVDGGAEDRVAQESHSVIRVWSWDRTPHPLTALRRAARCARAASDAARSWRMSDAA